MHVAEQLNLTLIVPDGQEMADLMRLVRLFLTEVEMAGEQSARLTGNSPLINLARQLLDATPGERGSTRTALMALRDLVWRVESVRYAVADRLGNPEREALLEILDMADIRLFLSQEP